MSKKIEALIEHIKAENLSLIQDILQDDPGLIEKKDAQGRPLSFLVAESGNLEIMTYVVNYSRASFNEVDQDHQTILHYATRSGQLPLVRFLVEKVGMSPVAGDKNLVTPLDIAVKRANDPLVKYYESVIGADYSQMYRNPIRNGMYPDPSIVRVGEDYYMVNSSFIYFPCIPISHSKDLIHWEIIGHAITRSEWAYLDTLEGGRGYWAPDISYNDGKFYITATYRMNDTGSVYRHQVVMSSDQPQGPYSKPSIIEEDGIDPSIFTDDDGRRYMLLNRGARIFRISHDGSRQLSEAKLLYYGSQKRAPEGPHLLKKDGWYYLFLAEGGTGVGHRITVARSRTLYGTYEACPYNPIMRQEDPGGAIQRCGHGKPVETQNGQWYMVYLCGRMIGDGYSLLGRETALDPITWTMDGWPIVNNLQGPSALQIKPNLKAHQFESKNKDDFDGRVLDKGWMFPRPPESDGYRLEGGRLILKGSKARLASIEARNIALKRQSHYCFTASTALEFVAMTQGQEAGMTCYYDENTWLTYGLVAGPEGDQYLRVQEHIDTETKVLPVEVKVPYQEGLLYLRILTKYLERSFQYSFDGQHYETLASLDKVYYLCDEGLKKGKRFTGAMIGLYAYAGKADFNVAFDYFSYEDD